MNGSAGHRSALPPAKAMYARNIVTFLKNMITKDGQLNIDTNDEITAC